MFTRILLASDGSNGALCAARSVAALVRQLRAMIIVVYVSNYPDTTTPFDGAAAELLAAESASNPMEETALENARIAIQRTKAALNGDPTENQTSLDYSVREYIGDPADTILSVAEQEEADLIVLGSSGSGGIRRLFLGSVSEKVAREAHCSVLIVRAGEEDEEKEKQ